MKKLWTVFVLTLLLCGGMNSSAQSNRFTNGTEGTDFWFSFPVAYPELGGDNALKIYVSCEVATACTVEVPGLGVRYIKTTKPKDVIEFELHPSQGQPYESMGRPDSAKSEQETYASGKGKGIHVYADFPLVVYGVSRYTYSSDSFIALPVSSLGTEYIIASYADMSGTMFPGLHLPSQAVVVAAYDSTTVSFTLGGSQGTETIGGLKRGETRTFKLNKGDLVAFGNKKANGISPDLSGSRITSDKPIAVTSGNQCANIPVNNQWCDFIMEMELPTHTWGTEYHVTNFVNRKNYSYIKVFAKNPNTNLYRDGELTPFATITTAGGNQNTGYYEGRIMTDGSDPKPVIIKADGPISITQFNPGQQEDNVTSDPFQLVLTPIEQYQKEIVFNTPGIMGGQSFKHDFINIVFESDSNNLPDDLEFGIVQSDSIYWRSLKSVFNGIIESFKGFAGDTKKYYLKVVCLPPGDGVYRIRAPKPFAVYAYGVDSYDSYAHPTSLILNDISSRDDLAPGIVLKKDDTSSATFTVQDGGTSPSKISRVFLNPSTSSNYVLKTDEFIPGQAQSVTFRAEVVNPFQDAKAEIVVVDRAGNYSFKTLAYKAGKTGDFITMTDFNFGNVAINEERIGNIKIENTGNTAEILDTLLINGTEFFSLFNLPDFPLTLQPQEVITVGVQFLSSVVGEFSATVYANNPVITDNAILYAKAIIPTGIERVYDPSFNISPNPATGFTTIDLPVFKSQNPLLKMYDALGNEVADFSAEIKNTDKSELRFNTSQLPNGMYIVRFIDGDATIHLSFVIQN